MQSSSLHSCLKGICVGFGTSVQTLQSFIFVTLSVTLTLKVLSQSLYNDYCRGCANRHSLQNCMASVTELLQRKVS